MVDELTLKVQFIMNICELKTPFFPLHLSDNHKDKKLIIIIPVVVGFVSVSALIIIAWCWMVKRKGEICL